MLDFPDRSTAHLTVELYDEITSRLRLALANTHAQALLDDSILLVVPFEQRSGDPPRQVTRGGTALLLLVNQPQAAKWHQEVYVLKDPLALIGETFFQGSGLPHLLLKRQYQDTVLGQRSPDRSWRFWSYPENS